MTSPRQVDSVDATDIDAIEATVRDYIEGWYSGDTERMDRALHDDLAKRIPADGDALREVTKGQMLESTAVGGGDGQRLEVEIDDVVADIATARVVSEEYLDYMHLVKTSSGWKIVNVLFTTHI